MKVALFAEMSDSILQLTREFISNGIDVDNLEAEGTACEWLQDGPASRGAFILFMDHRKQLTKGLQEQLRRSKGAVLRILCFRGFNPDEISHLKGDVVDVLCEEYGHPRENLKVFLSELETFRSQDSGDTTE